MFEFTNDDLRSNQQGQISARQREWLEGHARAMRRWQGATGWFLLVFIPIPIFLILSLFLRNESTRKVLSSAAPALGAAFCFVVLAAIASTFLGRQKIRRQSDELLETKLLVDEGKAKIVTTFSARWGSGEYLLLDDRKFMVAASNAFKEGQRYRVYFSRTSVGDFILSCEEIK